MKNKWFKKSIVFGMFLMLVFVVFATMSVSAIPSFALYEDSCGSDWTNNNRPDFSWYADWAYWEIEYWEGGWYTRDKKYGDYYTKYLDGSQVGGSRYRGDDSTWHYRPTLSDGIHTFYVKSEVMVKTYHWIFLLIYWYWDYIDTYWYTSGISNTITVKIDTTDPSTPNPTDNWISWTHENTPTFHWPAASDSLSGVKGYWWSIDGHPPTWTTSTIVTVPPQSDGTHTFYVQVEDNAGNRGISGTHNFYIDTAAPSTPTISSSTHPIETSWYPNNDPLFSWNAVGGPSPVIYHCKIDDGSFHSTTITSKSYSDLSDGIHTFYLCASDIGGTSGIDSYTMKIDTMAPAGSVTINSGDASTDSTSVTLTLGYSDSLSGVSQVRYSNDGVFDTESWETPAGIKSWTLTVGDGTKTVWYQIKDNVGNTYTTSDSIELITNQPPVADAGGPYSGNEGSPITFDASYSTDPDEDDLQYRWDFNNDGTWDTSYSTDPTAAHIWYDEYTGEVTVEVYDGEYTDTDTSTVTVNNVDPELTLSGPSTVDEGSIYTLGLNSYDPGDDTITEWEIDWGDGTVETIPGNPSTVTHIYADGPNGYTISAKAFDEDSYGNTLITYPHDNRVIEVDSAGNIVWEMTGLNYPNDAERLDNGNTLIVECDHPSHSGSVTEYTSEGNIVWQYTDLNIPQDSERLDNGNTLIADQHNNRVIEVNSDKQIVWKVDTNLKNTGITYLHYPVDVERLDNGNTLIVDMYNDRIIEIEADFDVVWESPWTGYYTMYDTERLDNGNTLIPFAVFGTVEELDNNFNVIWQTGVSYPVDAERLDNGNTLIVEWYGNRVIEVDSAGNIVWKYDGLNCPYDVERLGFGIQAYNAVNTIEITVNNVAPTLTLSGSSSVDEGAVYTLSLFSSDPGDETITEWEIDWGDGTVETVSGNPSLATHTYADGPNDFTISATATDEDGTYAAGNTIDVSVNNVAPTVTAPTDTTGDEGSPITIGQTTFIDPGADIYTATINWGDTTIDDLGTVTSPIDPQTHTYSEDGIYTVTVTVTDDDGGFGSDSLIAVVNNVAPTVDVLDVTSPINENDIATLTATASDPGSDDTTLDYEIDWGDGCSVTTGSTSDGTISKTHQYLDDDADDTYTLTLTITDSDGATDIDTFDVTVNNLAPTVDIDDVVQPYSEFILPDDVLEFYGSFTDPGTLDDHTYEWDFDDGTIVTGTLTPTHAYTEPGPYTVTLNVTDDDSGMGTVSIEIVVESPAGATEEVIDDVEEMDLPVGIETALTCTLDAAINSLDNGHTTAAINQLNAFINQVNAQRTANKLTDEEADALIAAAQWIIDNLNNG